MPFGTGDKLITLINNRDVAEHSLKLIKKQLEGINEQIKTLASSMIAPVYEREGKADGTIRFVSDNHLFKCVLPKRVEWDSGKLANVARDMPPGEAALLFKIEYSVPEARFKSITDTILRHNLMQARTVKYGEPKITLADGEDN
jgi:hypothetical protein